MNVLIVSSGNSHFGLSPIVKKQSESLKANGVNITNYTIKGKGIVGYLRNVIPLKLFIKRNEFNLIHAHFSLSAFTTSLAGAKPLIVSLMGWNVRLWYLKILIRVFNRFFWDACIVKSQSMKIDLGIEKLFVIPNGVDLVLFRPIPKIEAQNRIEWNPEKRHILFAADRDRPVKNFDLARKAISILNQNNIVLHTLNNVPHNEMVYYYNACDVALLTSRAEGSPNVIKEAMACNCPIVTTDVGDVRETIGNTEGCFISHADAEDIACNLNLALKYNKKTNGREHIIYLDADKVAGKIIDVYKFVLNR